MLAFRRTAARCALVCALVQPLLLAAQAPATTPWPTKEWSVSTPAAEGLDAAVLAELLDYLATPSLQTDSVIVVRHGRIVTEAYAPPFHAALRHDLRSVTKSVVATLVGAAIQDGRIASADQKVLGLLPGQKANGPLQEAMSVRNLLDMASGIQWREWPYNEQSDARKLWEAPDWTRFILEREVTQTPGEKFHYIAAAPHLLSVVLTHRTGSKAADYARDGLFRKLGITDFSWHADPQGHSVGESTLRLRPLDMAKVGLLHLRGGRWEDQQVLPPGWTDALFAPGLPTAGDSLKFPPTYRGLWWTDASVPYAAAMGRHGQHIIVLPRQDLLLVITSKTADTTRDATPPDLVRRYLLPAVKADAGLAADPVAAGKLAAAVGRFQGGLDHPSRTPSPAAEALSRRTFAIEPNAWGYTEFSLELSGERPRYRIMVADKTLPSGQSRRGGVIGLDGRYVVSTQPGERLWARRGRWIDETTFRIQAQFMEAAIVSEWTARFEDGGLELMYSDGDGEVRKVRGKPRD